MAGRDPPIEPPIKPPIKGTSLTPPKPIARRVFGQPGRNRFHLRHPGARHGQRCQEPLQSRWRSVEDVTGDQGVGRIRGFTTERHTLSLPHSAAALLVLLVPGLVNTQLAAQQPKLELGLEIGLDNVKSGRLARLQSKLVEFLRDGLPQAALCLPSSSSGRGRL